MDNGWLKQEIVENLVVFLLSFFGFWLSFFLTWKISERKITSFAKFPSALKADWCSRVNSTLHAIIIVVGVVTCLTSIDWTTNMTPVQSVTPSRIVFSIAVGYFLSDLGVILLWCVPMWKLFAIHHTVAVMPYLINNFWTNCAFCQYELLLFLLVEIATLPLNACGFLETIGMRETRHYQMSFYVMYFFWALSRVGLPIYLMFTVWAYVMPQASSNKPAECLYPSLICAHVITLFCVGVFVFIHTPEFIKHLGVRKFSFADIGSDDSSNHLHSKELILSGEVSSSTERNSKLMVV